MIHQINYEGVALEFLIEHPRGELELEQLKRKLVLLSVRSDMEFEELYDKVILELRKISMNNTNGKIE